MPAVLDLLDASAQDRIHTGGGLESADNAAGSRHRRVGCSFSERERHNQTPYTHRVANLRTAIDSPP